MVTNVIKRSQMFAICGMVGAKMAVISSKVHLSSILHILYFMQALVTSEFS